MTAHNVPNIMPTNQCVRTQYTQSLTSPQRESRRRCGLWFIGAVSHAFICVARWSWRTERNVYAYAYEVACLCVDMINLCSKYYLKNTLEPVLQSEFVICGIIALFHCYNADLNLLRSNWINDTEIIWHLSLAVISPNRAINSTTHSRQRHIIMISVYTFIFAHIKTHNDQKKPIRDIRISIQ